MTAKEKRETRFLFFRSLSGTLYFLSFFFLPSFRWKAARHTVHAGRVIVTNYPNDDTIKISRGLRGTGVFSLSEQTVSLYDPSLPCLPPSIEPDQTTFRPSSPPSLAEPPPHTRRVIGTRPQPPPLFNTPAPAYSTPATGELPPYIHQRGCIQLPLLPPSFCTTHQLVAFSVPHATSSLSIVLSFNHLLVVVSVLHTCVFLSFHRLCLLYIFLSLSF